MKGVTGTETASLSQMQFLAYCLLMAKILQNSSQVPILSQKLKIKVLKKCASLFILISYLVNFTNSANSCFGTKDIVDPGIRQFYTSENDRIEQLCTNCSNA